MSFGTSLGRSILDTALEDGGRSPAPHTSQYHTYPYHFLHTPTGGERLATPMKDVRLLGGVAMSLETSLAMSILDTAL